MQENFNHITVLKKETIHSIIPSNKLLLEFLEKKEENIFIIDATLGGAGHALYIVEYFEKTPELKNFKLNLIAIDRDINAINAAKFRLSTYQEKFPKFSFQIYYDNFSNLKKIMEANYPGQKIHGLYADFGVSSPQLDQKHRGFSFLHDGPVDMRMDPEQSFDAKELLSTYSEKELARVFFDYGEEPRSRKLAQKIVMDRNAGILPISSSREFAEYIKRILAYPSQSKVHPATRAFQALRIEVNNELESIENLLNDIPSLMHPLGKAAFISFHSLEDRLVKHSLRQWQRGKLSSEKKETKNDFNLPLHIQLYLYDNKQEGFGKEVPRGGITASEEEIKQNPRSRSARLRCFEFNKLSEESKVV